MTLAEKVASKLHEDWRKTRLKEDGHYEPRWKKVKDIEFVKRLDFSNLPANVRINGDDVEIDIANSSYFELSEDWKAENKAAGEVVADIVKSGQNLSREEAGEIIHEAWLARNSWAADDPVLSKPFAELPEEEQEKDIAQLRIAQEAYAEMNVQK